MHANIYRQQQELQKQAAKEFAAINNWRYTAKNQALGTLVSPQNAWFSPLLRLIIDPTQAPVWLILHISPKYLKALINWLQFDAVSTWGAKSFRSIE
jgi:hypothetical protein